MLDTHSPMNDNFRRDREVADVSLLDPTSPNAFEAGEFLVIDTSRKLARIGVTSVPSVLQIFTPRGDYSAQAIGKLAVIELSEYEASTDMYADGGGGFVMGQGLTAKQITVDAVTRSGLTQAATGEFVVAHVTDLPANNAGKIKFKRISPYVAP